MPPRPDTNDAVVRRAPFGAGWTGALAIGIFVYILLATVLIFVDRSGGRVSSRAHRIPNAEFDGRFLLHEWEGEAPAEP